MADETAGQPASAAPEKTTTEVKTEANTEVKETTQEKTEVAVKPEATKDTKTALATPDGKTEVVPDFPEDWREKLAKGDEKRLKRLQRFKSPQDVYEWGENAEKAWKQGKDPDPFPDKGTDEEKAAWRKANNIPNDPGEYIKDLTLPDGLVIGENDKPAVDQFLAAAHANNRKPDDVKQTLAWYFKWREDQAQAIADKDLEDRSTVSEELTREWGPETKKYLGAAYELVRSVGDEADLIMDARLPDGTKLGNHPKIIKWLAQTSLELNPALSVIPTKGSDAMTSLKARMTELENVMKTDRNKYFREGLDKEYQRLVEVEEKASKRHAA